MLMDSRFIDAKQAFDLGLVEDVSPENELDAHASSLARKLAEGPTAAYGAIRRLTDAAFGNDLEAQFALETESIVELAGRPGAAEILNSVMNKQRPVFKG